MGILGRCRTEARLSQRRAIRWVSACPILAAILICNVAVEALLIAADLQLILPRGRSLAYQYGAFWAGLLQNWRPNYPAQPYAVFATYAFLHAGALHLAVNMVTLVSLGTAAVRRVGCAAFAALYLVSMLAGALGFALGGNMVQPMVGASGALFGLAGALLTWELLDRRAAREDLRGIWIAAALLVLMNVLLWWLTGGRVAWQAHLGGFAGGVAAAPLMRRRQ